MNLNNLLEEITSPEAKKKFKELVKKYHPDVGGSTETTKKINIAKDKGDRALLRLYKELTGKKIKKEKSELINLLKQYTKWVEKVEDFIGGAEGGEKLAQLVNISIVDGGDGENVTIEIKTNDGTTYNMFNVEEKYPREAVFVGALFKKTLEILTKHYGEDWWK